MSKQLTKLMGRPRNSVLTVAFAIIALISTRDLPAASVTDSFTDSQGRTLLYRYTIENDQNSSVPNGILIYFHGNNTGTQTDMLNGFHGWIQAQAREFGLIPVTVASPESSPRGKRAWLDQAAVAHTGSGTRFWSWQDQKSVHELVQSEFNGSFKIDFDQVIFWGGSQGTCFLNDFMPRYGRYYGGGFLGDCGCSEGLPSLWQPTDRFREGFRVFIRSTTEDFLHTLSLQAYGYYKYVAGLQTRRDLDAPGEHCSRGNISNRTAIRWLLDGTGLADDPPEPHLKRMSLIDHITGITVDTDGALWVIRQVDRTSPAKLFRSVDRGLNFEFVSQVSHHVADIDAVAQSLVLTVINHERREIHYYRSTDGGNSFDRLELTNSYARSPVTTSDLQGQVFTFASTRYDGDVLASADQGETWESLHPPMRFGGFSTPDPIATDESTGYLFLNQYGNYYPPTAPIAFAGTTQGNDWSPVADTTDGPVYSIAWDGTRFFGLAGDFARLYSSTDRGSTWQSSKLPKAAEIEFGNYTLPRVSALGHGESLLIGGGYDGFLHNSQGNWQHFFGGRSIGLRRHERGTVGGIDLGHLIGVDGTRGDVFVSHRQGIFRLDGEFRASSAISPAQDVDSDGISDKLDAFPQLASEYLDTDGDGRGNNEDDDDDGDGVNDENDAVPLDPTETIDTDFDGVGDTSDQDDDGDGIWDTFDAFPLDQEAQRDSDGDGIANSADPDDDGDGVDDVVDAFPLYPHEWLDTDRDGIGDNIDADDDNDGLADEQDAAPKEGPPRPHLFPLDLLYGHDYDWRERQATLHAEQPADYLYPEFRGLKQDFGYVRLGDGPDPDIQFLIDHFAQARVLHIDRNDNGDLTDDGPPVQISNSLADWLSVEVTYSSGITVPYGMSLANFPTIYRGGAWIGEVTLSDGSTVLVVTIDYDIDGIFSGPEDYVCVDVNGDGELACNSNDQSEQFRPDDAVKIRGQQLRVLVADSGHRVELVSEIYKFASPVFPSASHPSQQGFVRVINRSDVGGKVTIEGFDEAGNAYGPITLTIGASEAVHFNSDDVEEGNPEKGLSAGLGAGEETWRLSLESSLEIDVLSYIRTSDGFLTSMHDTVPQRDGSHEAPIFNPGSNENQVSRLRLINQSSLDAQVEIEGVDDAGQASGLVQSVLRAGESRTLSSAELETGAADGITGSLGDGEGKWRLNVSSDNPIVVVSLLESPTGHLTNLSTHPSQGVDAARIVSMFPAASHPTQQGFVRVINRGDVGGEVTIEGFDEAGNSHGSITLTIGAAETVHFNSDDAEKGNPEKGLSAGLGAGDGTWRLNLQSSLEIDVLSYIRTSDGFLTSMHDTVPQRDGSHEAPIFNPGSNENQVSRLRLINQSSLDARVEIEGVDDAGQASGLVQFVLGAGESRTLSSAELETGVVEGITGSLGNGEGKWRLNVSSDKPIVVVSLLETPTGHLTNLSTSPDQLDTSQVHDVLVDPNSVEAYSSFNDTVSQDNFYNPGLQLIRPIR